MLVLDHNPLRPVGNCSGRKRPSKFVFGGHLFLPKGTGREKSPIWSTFLGVRPQCQKAMVPVNYSPLIASLLKVSFEGIRSDIDEHRNLSGEVYPDQSRTWNIHL